MKKSKHRTKGEMEGLIAAWQESGQSKKDFCAERQVKVHTFQYWYQKYREAPGQDEQGPAFIRLSPPEEAHQGGHYTISYPNGVRLQISRAVSTSELIKLLGLA